MTGFHFWGVAVLFVSFVLAHGSHDRHDRVLNSHDRNARHHRDGHEEGQRRAGTEDYYFAGQFLGNSFIYYLIPASDQSLFLFLFTGKVVILAPSILSMCTDIAH